jgi:hypothetical protein
VLKGMEDFEDQKLQKFDELPPQQVDGLDDVHY